MQNLKQIIRQEIAPQLIDLRKQKGLSIQDVALQTPLSMNMISLMEQGAPLAVRYYQRLLKFYGKKLEIRLADLKQT